MSSYILPDWDDIDEINTRDILPSPVMFSQPRMDFSSKHLRHVDTKQSPVENQTTSSNSRQSAYNPVSAERDIIMQKDLQLLECKRVFGAFSSTLATLNDVILTIGQSFENQGGIETKDLQKALQPLQNMIRDLNVANEICPREAVVLQSNIQKLVQESKSAFTVIGHCMGEKSRLYKEQLKKMREISNISTRNALQAERGDHSMNLMRLKSQFDAESAKLRASLNDKDEEHERVVAVLHEKMEKLRRANKELENTQEEASVAKIRERIDRAVQHALSDQRHEQEAKIEALNQSWEMRINSIEESWQRKMSDSDKIHQERLELQGQHHEKIAEILMQEKDKLQEDCHRLKLEMQSHTEELAAEKAKLLDQRNEEMRQRELDNDLRNSEHVKTVSTIKAELAAKVRQTKEEERRRSEELEVNFNKEREQIESAHAAEVDRLIGQHRRSLQQLRAQLEVKFEEELTSIKRRQENELKRYASEIDRLRRLVARRGTGGGQDGVSLVTYDDNEGGEGDQSRSSYIARGNDTQINSSQTSLFSRRSKSPPRATDGLRSDFNKTIRTQNDFTKTVRNSHDQKASSSNQSRFVQFDTEKKYEEANRLDAGGTAIRSPVFSPSHRSPSTRHQYASDSHRSPKLKQDPPVKSGGLKWGALQESLAQQDDLLQEMSLGSGSPSSGSARDSARRSTDYDRQSSQSSPQFTRHEGNTSSLGYSPSPVSTSSRRYTGQIYTEEDEEGRTDIPPPPPPPDPYALEIALEESKVPGHNISSNAANVGKYMRQLQLYLQGQEGAGSDSVFSSMGDVEEEAVNLDENISFPSDYLGVVDRSSSWRDVERSFELSGDFDEDSLSED